jgi:predicted enzyme related to lactoylglutathione lyase
MTHALSWFEIPVQDLARARRFYGSLLQAELRQETVGDADIAILPHAADGVGGALAHGARFVPGKEGTLVYLDAGEDLDGALGRVAAGGGKVLMGRLQLSDTIGSIAFFEDTEGNRVGLHSPR